ncbi:MAG TPA: winged helix-turn-helix domain-containing protein [Pyrinomonadaceae bacterium]
MKTNGRREIYEFGELRLDLGECTIERIDGRALAQLPEKTLLLMGLLVRRRGHLVTKDEILDQIWPNTVVEENNIDKRVSYLRRFLVQSGSGEKFIETVRGRGYRFVGDVRVVEVSGTWLPETLRPHLDKPAQVLEGNGHQPATTVADSEVSRPDDRPPEKANSADARLMRKAGFAVAAVVVAILAGYFGFVRTGSASPSRSIAVLPVAPIDTSDRNLLYEVGITESIIHRLSSFEGLIVKPLNSVRAYTGHAVDPIAAGREQRVDYVLMPSYQIAGDKMKVTYQLFDVATGKVEDSAQSQQPIADIFAAQEAVAAAFGSRLMARFGTTETGPVRGRGTDNEDAYRHYQLAMNFNEQRGSENGRKALEHIEQAVALDPNFAMAWAAKAYIHRYNPSHGSEKHEQYRKSMEAVEKALSIDPNLSEAYSALCFNKNRYEYDAAGAEAACRRALELDPDSALAHKLYSNFLYSRGRFDESISAIKRALELQPVSYDNQQTYALALYYARRYGDSEVEWKRLIRLNPDHGLIYNFLIECLKRQGRESEAFEFMLKRLEIDKTDAGNIERFKKAYGAFGWRGVTLERIRIVKTKADPDASALARLHAELGDKDKAFEYLERSFEARSNLIAVLGVDPNFDILRDDPRYHDLVKRIEAR